MDNDSSPVQESPAPQEPEKDMTIPAETFYAVVRYLGQQPWNQVADLMNALIRAKQQNL